MSHMQASIAFLEKVDIVEAINYFKISFLLTNFIKLIFDLFSLYLFYLNLV